MRSRFGVVIPVYNGEKYIRRAVESVLGQTLPAGEIVVVDDGSTDGTEAVLSEFTGKIRVVRTENKGVGAARNAGTRFLKTDYVAFLDADDIWLPEKIALFEEASRRRKEAALFFSDAVVISDREKPLGLLKRSPPPGPLYETLLQNNIIVTSTLAAKRAAMEEAGPFLEDFRCKAGVEDWEFSLRLSRRGDYSYVPVPLTLYRRHDVSAIQTQGRSLLEDSLRVLEIQEGFENLPLSVRKNARAHVYFAGGERFLAVGEMADARRNLRKSMESEMYFFRSVVLWSLSFLGKPGVKFMAAVRNFFRKSMLTARKNSTI